MRQAGQHFREIGLDRHAAQCFYSGDDNANAVELFVKLGMVGQAAESFLQLGKLREAANLFSRAGLFANAFECYERLQDWDGLIQCLYRYKGKLEERERATYIERYFPIALNSVYHLYAELDPEGAAQIGTTEENKGRVMQNRLRLKFQKSVSVIKEEVSENEDEDASESEEEEEQKAAAQDERKDSQSQPADAASGAAAQEESKARPADEAAEAQPPSGLVMIDTGRPATESQPEEEKKEESHADGESFELIEVSDDDDGEENKQGEDPEIDYGDPEGTTGLPRAGHGFEVLSQIDPEDEFLKSENSYSLIEKLSSAKESSFDVLSAHSSEFSILSGTKMHELLKSVRSDQNSVSLASEIQGLDAQSNASFAGLLNASKYSAVQYARDTYAEDIVIQKVIYYISLFKDDVRQALFAKRSKDQLAQVLADIDEKPAEESKSGASGDLAAREFEEDMDFMMIELDDLPQESLGLILDTLEHYELYRLCLILCGRYGLSERVGRYVSAVSAKYSNLNERRAQLQPANATAQANYALVAHEAMHNVISLAGSCLSEQVRGHAFRQSCFETLLLHGFWKKLIYMLDVDSSLQLSMAYGDDESFRLNYLVEKLGISDPARVQEALGSAEKFHELAVASESTTVADSHARSLLAKARLQGRVLSFEHITDVMSPTCHD